MKHLILLLLLVASTAFSSQLLAEEKAAPEGKQSVEAGPEREPIPDDAECE